MKHFRIMALCIVFAAFALAIARADGDPVDYVNPFIGTTYGGDTFPGPDYPFGMIQLGPDTTTRPAGGGYEYVDQRVTGFSVTHLSGPGCPVLNDLGILPVTGSIDDPQHVSIAFTHVQEHAQPGWYDVLLGDNMDLEASMTTTPRTALAAFRFPGGSPAHVLFNLGHSGTTVANASFAFRGDRAFDGYIRAGGFCGMPGHYSVFFTGEFDTPFVSSGKWDGASGPDAGAWADFGDAHRTVKLRVAISFVDLDGARRNLAAEATTWDLQKERSQAQKAWRAYLNHAAIQGGTDAERHSFWTAMYHALLHPNLISDVDRRYPGFDGKAHTAPHGHNEYGNWSGWDVYRTQLQLLGFLFPHETSDMVRSLLDANNEMGWLPRWSLVNDESSVMNGDPAPSLIADAYFFGARDFDRAKALSAMVHGATANASAPGQGWYQERNDIAQYERVGYVDSHRQNSVSHVPNGASETLEYAISDYAIAAFARELGNTAVYRTFLRRSGNWANLFDTAANLIEPRDENGNFVVVASTGEGQLGFQEGSAEQYTWVVPQDQSGLIRAHGGDAPAVRHLDRFFSALPEHDGDWGTPFIGLNNEPSFGAPFLYLSAHAPSRTQSLVRLIETKYFDNAPGGEPGNDDLGAMAAMYVWETAGLYPQTPGTDTLDLASPLFSHVELRSEDGRRIIADAPKARTSSPYVRAVRVNGRATSRTWIAVPRTGDVRLTFDVQSTPASWGSRKGDEPPSFDAGVRPPHGVAHTGAVTATRPPLQSGELASALFLVTYFDGTIVPFDPATMKTAPGFTLGLRVPDARAIPGTHLAVLAAIYDNSISFVDLTTRSLIKTVKAGTNPDALAVSNDGATLWVANRGDDTVQPFDIKTMTAGTAVKVRTRPVALHFTPGGRELLVVDQGANAVSAVDVVSKAESWHVATGEAPAAMAFGSNGLLYVANMFSNDVSVIDTATRTERTRVPVGVSPRSLVSFGGKIYVANWASSTVTVIDESTNGAIATVSTGDNPAALAVGPNKKLYVALSGDNAVQTIDLTTNQISPLLYTTGSSPRTIFTP